MKHKLILKSAVINFSLLSFSVFAKGSNPPSTSLDSGSIFLLIFFMLIIVVLIAFIIISIINGIRQAIESSKAIRKQRLLITTLKESVYNYGTGNSNDIALDNLDAYVINQIRFSTERFRLNMFQAEDKANKLFNLGVAFATLSVFAPIGTIILYLQTSPIKQILIPPESQETLGFLKDTLGITPEITFSMQRDWRILLLGISFGLLFLAASRGILGLESKMRELYQMLSDRVNTSENKLAAFQISERLQKEEAFENKPVLQKIINQMLDDSPATITRQERNPSNGNDLGSDFNKDFKEVLSEHIEQLKSIFPNENKI